MAWNKVGTGWDGSAGAERLAMELTRRGWYGSGGWLCGGFRSGGTKDFAAIFAVAC